MGGLPTVRCRAPPKRSGHVQFGEIVKLASVRHLQPRWTFGHIFRKSPRFRKPRNGRWGVEVWMPMFAANGAVSVISFGNRNSLVSFDDVGEPKVLIYAPNWLRLAVSYPLG